MKKMKSFLLVFILLASTMLTIIISNATAASSIDLFASIRTHDYEEIPESDFKLGSMVYFSVHVEDQFADPYTSDIYVYIYDSYNSMIEYVYVPLDYTGNGTGSFRLDSSYSQGTYRLDVKTSAYGNTYASTYISAKTPQYTAEIKTYDYDPDDGGNLENDFKAGEIIYFSVTVKDDSGNPLEYTSMYIYLYDSTDYQLSSEYLYLDDQGYDAEYFYTYPSYSPGKYTLKILMYEKVIGTHTIDLKEVKYHATIKTWDSNPNYYENAKEKNIFSKEDMLYFSVHIEDQDGDPYSGDYYSYAYVNLTYDDESIDMENVQINYNGNGTNYFRLYNFEDLEFGKYTLEVRFTGGAEVIGTHDIYIMDFELSLDKYIYAPGEIMKISVSVIPANIFTSLKVDIVNRTTEKSLKKWSDLQLDNEGKLYLEYKISETKADGDYNVSVLDSKYNLLGKTTFIIKLYNLIIYPDRRTFLPGDSVTVYYSLTSQKDGSGINVAKYEWDLRYSEEGTKHGTFTSSDSLGTFNINIPDDVEKGYAIISVKARETSGKHSAESSIGIYIGELNVNIYTDSDNYAPGDFVIIMVSADVYYSYYNYYRSGGGDGSWDTRTRLEPPYYYDDHGSPLKDARVEIEFLKYNAKSGKYDTLGQYSRAGLKTDAKGKCEYILMLGNDLKEGTYKIDATISKSGVKIAEEDASDSETISIGERISQMALELQFDKQYYMPGETVAVSYGIAYMDTGEGVRNGIIDYSAYYETGYYSDRVFIAVGRFNSPASEGAFNFKIPANLDGELYLQVTVTNETGGQTSKYETITVNYAILLMNVNKAEYQPGDEIIVNYDLNKFSGKIDFYYKVTYSGYSGYGLLTEEHFGTTKNAGLFNFTVPRIGIADDYSIQMYSVDSDNHYTENSISISRKSNYVMSISLDKDQYEKGDYIKINYKIIPQGTSRPPGYVEFYFGIIGETPGRFESDQPEGTFKYKIPESSDVGKVMLSINCELPLESDYRSSNMASIHTIEVLDAGAGDEGPAKELMNKLGVSTFDLILVIFIIVILVLLFVIKRRMSPKQKTGEKKLSRKEKRLLKKEAKMARRPGVAPVGYQAGSLAPAPRSTAAVSPTPTIAPTPTTSPTVAATPTTAQNYA
ncbi:MAG: hypothetical protein KAJ51_08885, partial [Thermoplasmata archaeon]|nr:hypothetical protein [Thermoplasmata archaeon]